MTKLFDIIKNFAETIHKIVFKSYRWLTGKDMVSFAFLLLTIINSITVLVLVLSPSVLGIILAPFIIWWRIRAYINYKNSVNKNIGDTVVLHEDSFFCHAMVFVSVMICILYIPYIVTTLSFVNSIEFLAITFFHIPFWVSLTIYEGPKKSIFAKAKEKIKSLMEVKTLRPAMVGA